MLHSAATDLAGGAASEHWGRSSTRPAGSNEIALWLGVYADPWFGEVSICPAHAGRARFVAAKSPMLAGTVMRMGERYFVDWDHDTVDVEAWLDFSLDDASLGAALALAMAMAMAKVDPDGDFSFDYEDLAFVRKRTCD